MTKILRLTTKHSVWEIDEEGKRFRRTPLARPEGDTRPTTWEPMVHFVLQEPRLSKTKYPGQSIREFTVFESPRPSKVHTRSSVALQWEEINT